MDYFNFLKNKTLELHVCAVSASLPLPVKLLPCAPAQIYNLYFVIVRHKHTHMHTCVYNLLNLLNVSLMLCVLVSPLGQFTRELVLGKLILSLSSHGPRIAPIWCAAT